MNKKNKNGFIRTRDLLATTGVKKNARGDIRITFEYEDLDVIRLSLGFAGAMADQHPELIKEEILPNSRQIEFTTKQIINALVNK